MCPKDVGKTPPNTSSLKPGDAVILHAASADDKFIEPLWARVVSVSPDRKSLYVEILAEQAPYGLRLPQSKQHGFYLGDRLIVGSDCIFDILAQGNKPAANIAVWCGPMLEMAEGKYKPVDTSKVKVGDMVRVLVGEKGGAWYEPLWVEVTGISTTGTVVRGRIYKKPTMTASHGLKQFGELEFTRDCVVGISNRFLLGSAEHG